jgi:hypothetical protein
VVIRWCDVGGFSALHGRTISFLYSHPHSQFFFFFFISFLLTLTRILSLLITISDSIASPPNPFQSIQNLAKSKSKPFQQTKIHRSLRPWGKWKTILRSSAVSLVPRASPLIFVGAAWKTDSGGLTG